MTREGPVAVRVRADARPAEPRPRAGGIHGRRALAAAALAALCLAAVSARYRSWVADPEVPLLVGVGDAEWIIAEEPFSLARRGDGETDAAFRKGFRIETACAEADLVLTAFRKARVLVDGTEVALPHRGLDGWKEPIAVAFGALAAGEHEIEVRVANRNAPPALLLRSSALGLATGGGWEASAGGSAAWRPAALADGKRRPALADELTAELGTAGGALGRLLPFHAPLFAAAALASWVASRRLRGPGSPGPGGAGSADPFGLSPSRVRFALLWAWALLAANNILRIPEGVGFDVQDHLDYMRHVAETRSIPLATDGWQMFQSPLYYIICAPLLAGLETLLGPITISGQLLRIVPLTCGAAQVEVVYRTLRIVFPERRDLQRVGLLVGGLLPMNLYMSQYLGNEPLAGLLSGMAILCALSIDGSARGPVLIRRLLLLGALLGLALLAKATAVLLVVPLAGFAALAAWRSGSLRRAAMAGAIPIAVAGAVSAPYYARNWVLLGKPFVGGWDPCRGITWWQDPGYRTPSQLASFGEALARPIHAAASSFWDGLYSTLFADGYLSSMIAADGRPPWNYGFLLSGALLALLPAAAMIAGIASGAAAALRRPAEPAREGALPARARAAALLSAACLGIYLAAMANLFISLPVYSTVKASYTSGLTPCYAILAAVGLGLLSRRPLVRAAIHGWLACWAAAAYLAYFVI